MKQIERDLQLPNINLKASLVAYVDAARKMKWYIKFYIPGPDRRYNPGLAVVSSYKVIKLIESLENAYQKMQVLEKENYSGKFREKFLLRGQISEELEVQVSCETYRFLFWKFKNIQLYFLVSSKTNTFMAPFSLKEVKATVDILRAVEVKAKKLIQELQC